MLEGRTVSVEEGEVRASVELGATEEEAAAVSVALDVSADADTDAGAEGAEECLCE